MEEHVTVEVSGASPKKDGAISMKLNRAELTRLDAPLLAVYEKLARKQVVGSVQLVL